MPTESHPEPSPDATTTGAPDTGTSAPLTLRAAHIHIAEVFVAFVALIALLYFARAFFIPLLLGVLGSYTLHPLVDVLERFRIPRSVGAALVLSLLIVLVGWFGLAMRDEAIKFAEVLPSMARELRYELNLQRTGTPSTLQNMQEAARELQGAAGDAGTQPPIAGPANTKGKGNTAVAPAKATRSPPQANEVKEPTWLSDYVLSQTALLVGVVAQTPIVLLLIYFLLAAGSNFRRKLIGLVGPSLTHQKETIRILEEIHTQVQRYMLSTLGSNVAIGLATWGVFTLLGVENAGVWGLAAGIAHFVPYLGPGAIAIACGIAAFVQTPSISHALLIAGTSLGISSFIGLATMGWIQSRFARVDTSVLFIALLFFGWLWGIWGLLLGAPIVAIAKVIFDRVDSLNSIGRLFGR
ncbi:MAG: AI-2E family transporter [Aeromicrobium sp.]|nr:AI-2E family transporter [Burkholderiales bacterium]